MSAWFLYFVIGAIWSIGLQAAFPERSSIGYRIWAFCLVAPLFPLSVAVLVLMYTPGLKSIYARIVAIIVGWIE